MLMNAAQALTSVHQEQPVTTPRAPTPVLVILVTREMAFLAQVVTSSLFPFSLFVPVV